MKFYNVWDVNGMPLLPVGFRVNCKPESDALESQVRLSPTFLTQSTILAVLQPAMRHLKAGSQFFQNVFCFHQPAIYLRTSEHPLSYSV